MGLTAATSSCGSSSASDDVPVTPLPVDNTPGNSGAVNPVTNFMGPGTWPADIGNGKQVIILGGGIAGMTAAYELSLLGYECTILEATGRA